MDGKSAKKVSLVLPVYNEAGVIEKVLKEYYEEVIKKVQGSELVVAEDGSTDGTKEILARVSEEIPIRLISGKERKGYVRALKDASKLPKNEIVFFSDSGGGHDPKDFFKLYRYIDDYDIVMGYKSPRQDAWYRIVLSKGYNTLIGLLFGAWYKDIDCGFRLIRKECLDDVMPKVHTLTQCIASEFVIRAKKKGYRIKEVPITHKKRDIKEIKTFSPKKIPKIVWEMFSGLIRLRVELFRKGTGKQKSLTL